MKNMTVNSKMQIDKDLDNKKMTLTRSFDAPVSDVWRAWTESELLDQWWAPKPWKAETKSMDFRVGGTWLYSMVGPDNTKHWARADYTTIDPKKSFHVTDSFCDENGNKTNDAPSMKWKNSFNEKGNGTEVTVQINFDSAKDLQTILDMGFEGGFTAGLNNLDELLERGI
jgi:uncharacterized protein YndB with AHSA1/START domain